MNAKLSWPTSNTSVESLYALIGGFIGPRVPSVALEISTKLGLNCSVSHLLIHNLIIFASWTYMKYILLFSNPPDGEIAV